MELVCLNMTHYAARYCVLGPWLCFPPTSLTQPSELSFDLALMISRPSSELIAVEMLFYK